MTDDLLVPVDDLIGSPGKRRPFSGSREVELHLGESTVSGPITVTGQVIGLIDAVKAELTAEAVAHLTCTRCLEEWDEAMTVSAEQFFRRIPDEDGYVISGDAVDISGPARDELALALPATPLCRVGCLGLCPTCGTDLNDDPCGGHGDDSDSPFAVLKDLFDS